MASLLAAAVRVDTAGPVSSSELMPATPFHSRRAHRLDLVPPSPREGLCSSLWKLRHLFYSRHIGFLSGIVQTQVNPKDRGLLTRATDGGASFKKNNGHCVLVVYVAVEWFLWAGDDVYMPNQAVTISLRETDIPGILQPPSPLHTHSHTPTHICS